MNVSAKLLLTVREYLRERPPAGLKAIEISVLPEGKVPASMGQRWLTIHATNCQGVTPTLSIRKRVITFGLTLNQRIRDIPNDEFGEIAYLDSLSMTEVLDELIPIIEAESFFQEFKSALDQVHVSEHITTPRYQLTDSFRFLSINLDPQHLYPSDFLTRNNKNDKEQLYDKIAGYKMTAMFESPEIQESYPPLQCRRVDD